MHAGIVFNMIADGNGFAGWLGGNFGWLLAALIVVLGLFVFGFRDIKRFSIRRTWAIADVCFDESIRRRVLWLTPLAIAGILIVTQLQRGFDEQDLIRQTVKTCLFTTGLVVILSSIILACTNLPREIENRVIYTIVTKPSTRLELIVGKIIGFARVSLAILIIMGLFTWGYLRIRAHAQSSAITARLQEGELAGGERDRLVHYQKSGLLRARSVASPTAMEMFARQPDAGSDVRVIGGDGAEHVGMQFPIDRQALFGPEPAGASNEDWSHQGAGDVGLVIEARIRTHRTGEATDQQAGQGVVGPRGPVMAPATKPGDVLPPMVQIQAVDDQGYAMIQPNQLPGASTVSKLMAEIGDFTRTLRVDPSDTGPIRLGETGGDDQTAYVWIPPAIVQANLFNRPAFRIDLTGLSANTDYLIGPHPLRVFVPQVIGGRLALAGDGAREVMPQPIAEGKLELFRGNRGIRSDQELKGGANGTSPVASFEFRNRRAVDLEGRIPFEIRMQIERGGTDSTEGEDDPTRLNVTVVDGATGKASSQIVPIETGEPAFFSVPASSITGPDFDVLLKCENDGHLLQLFDDSVKLVVGTQSFEVNLFKSLAIIWMMSILVITFAILCSTFLSWPIAIVLTIILLLGHWGVNQLADAAAPGLGRQIVNDAGFRDPAMSNMVSTGVDALSRALGYASRILPDTAQFDAIGEIEQGVIVSRESLMSALLVLVAFGLPATVLGYLVLQNKEVAP